MQRKILVLLGACLFLSPAIGRAQASNLNYGTNGAGVRVGVLFGGEGFDGLGFQVLTTIGGLLDVGADIGVHMAEIQNSLATEYRVAVVYSILALKQESRMPFSLQLHGSYGFTTVRSSYLTDNKLYKEGRGFTAGLALLRDFALSPAWGIRLGLSGTYEAAKFLTAVTETGVSVPGVPATTVTSTFYVGLDLGAVFKLGTPKGPGMYLLMSVLADPGFESLKFVPTFGVTLPAEI